MQSVRLSVRPSLWSRGMRVAHAVSRVSRLAAFVLAHAVALACGARVRVRVRRGALMVGPR
jgi:hypothetical protein